MRGVASTFSFGRLRDLRQISIKPGLIWAMLMVILLVGVSGIFNAASTSAESMQISHLPGGPTGDPTIDLSHGAVQSNFSLGGTMDGSSPAYSLHASYSSNVKGPIKTWIHDYQAGELGLGWTMEHPRIIRLNQGTGRIDDDKFVYYATGHGMQELKYVSSDGDFETHAFKSAYQPTTKIQRFVGDDDSYWIVTMPNGVKYYYGGKWGIEDPDSYTDDFKQVCAHLQKETPAAGRCQSGGIEYGVQWGDWVGASQNPKNQTNIEVAWNLSRIESITGKATTLSYINHIQDVGRQVGDLKPKAFSKSAYLYRVEQESGAKTVVVYCAMTDGSKGNGPALDDEAEPASHDLVNTDTSKDHYANICTAFPHLSYGEFADPHTESAEPDGYQERLKTVFIGGTVSFVAGSAIPKGQVALSYDFLASDSDEMVKRILTGVQPQTYDEEQGLMLSLAPPTLFSYWGEDADDGVSVGQSNFSAIYSADTKAFYGAMKSITSSTGLTKTYTYQQQDLDISRELEVPSKIKNARSVLFSDGYIILVGADVNNGLTLEVVEWTPLGWDITYTHSGEAGSHPGLFYRPYDMITMQRGFFAFVKADGKHIQVVSKNNSTKWNNIDPIELPGSSESTPRLLQTDTDESKCVGLDISGLLIAQNCTEAIGDWIYSIQAWSVEDNSPIRSGYSDQCVARGLPAQDSVPEGLAGFVFVLYVDGFSCDESFRVRDDGQISTYLRYPDVFSELVEFCVTYDPDRGTLTEEGITTHIGLARCSDGSDNQTWPFLNFPAGAVSGLRSTPSTLSVLYRDPSSDKLNVGLLAYSTNNAVGTWDKTLDVAELSGGRGSDSRRAIAVTTNRIGVALMDKHHNVTGQVFRYDSREKTWSHSNAANAKGDWCLTNVQHRKGGEHGLRLRVDCASMSTDFGDLRAGFPGDEFVVTMSGMEFPSDVMIDGKTHRFDIGVPFVTQQDTTTNEPTLVPQLYGLRNITTDPAGSPPHVEPQPDDQLPPVLPFGDKPLPPFLWFDDDEHSLENIDPDLSTVGTLLPYTEDEKTGLVSMAAEYWLLDADRRRADGGPTIPLKYQPSSDFLTGGGGMFFSTYLDAKEMIGYYQYDSDPESYQQYWQVEKHFDVLAANCTYRAFDGDTTVEEPIYYNPQQQTGGLLNYLDGNEFDDRLPKNIYINYQDVAPPADLGCVGAIGLTGDSLTIYNGAGKREFYALYPRMTSDGTSVMTRSLGILESLTAELTEEDIERADAIARALQAFKELQGWSTQLMIVNFSIMLGTMFSDILTENWGGLITNILMQAVFSAITEVMQQVAKHDQNMLQHAVHKSISTHPDSNFTGSRFELYNTALVYRETNGTMGFVADIQDGITKDGKDAEARKIRKYDLDSGVLSFQTNFGPYLRTLVNGTIGQANAAYDQDDMTAGEENDYFALGAGRNFITYKKVAKDGKYTCWKNEERRLTSAPITDRYDDPCLFGTQGSVIAHRVMDEVGIGKLQSIVVDTVTYNDGLQDSKVSYDFDTATAGHDRDAPNYHQVTIYPGGREGGNGRIEQLMYNGVEAGVEVECENLDADNGNYSACDGSDLQPTEDALVLREKDDEHGGWKVSENGPTSVSFVGERHNDKASVVKVAEGYTAVLYKHTGFTGKSLVVDGPRTVRSDELGDQGLDDEISSYKLFYTARSSQLRRIALRGNVYERSVYADGETEPQAATQTRHKVQVIKRSGYPDAVRVLKVRTDSTRDDVTTVTEYEYNQYGQRAGTRTTTNNLDQSTGAVRKEVISASQIYAWQTDAYGAEFTAQNRYTAVAQTARHRTSVKQAQGYQIVGRGGKCISAQGGGATNGTNVGWDECDDGHDQIWRRSSQTHHIIAHEGACLTADGLDYYNVKLWQCGQRPNFASFQGWHYDENTEEIIGQVDALPEDSCIAGDGSNIHLVTCNDGENQKWEWVAAYGPPSTQLLGSTATTYAQVDIVGMRESVYLPKSSYVYQAELDETDTPAFDPAQPGSGWIALGETTTYDGDSGIPTVTTNVQTGQASSLLLTNAEPRIAYATFGNANVQTLQASYTGFETYEDQDQVDNFTLSGFTPSGDSTDPPGYSGDKSYGADSVNVTIEVNSYNIPAGRPALLSAWVKPDKGQTCQLGIGQKTATAQSGDGQTWQYLEVTAAAGAEASVSCGHGGYVDEVLVRPVDSSFGAKAHDAQYRITETTSNNGVVTHLVRDRRNRLLGSYQHDPYGKARLLGLPIAGFSRYNGYGFELDEPVLADFNQDQPNHSATVVFQDDTNAYFEPSLSNGQSHNLVASGRFAMRMLVHEDKKVDITVGSDTSAKLSLLAGTDDETEETYLVLSQGGVSTKSDNLPVNSTFRILTWIVNDHFSAVFLDGKMVIATNGLTLLPDPDSPNITFNNGSYSNVFVGQDPLFARSFHDGAGRAIQTQSLSLDYEDWRTQVKISQVLYDGWGKPAVQTKLVERDQTLGDYDTGFVTGFDWANDSITGHITGAFDNTSHNTGHPFTRTRYADSPLLRPARQSLLPGDEFDIDSTRAETFGYGSVMNAADGSLLGKHDLYQVENFLPYTDEMMLESTVVSDKAGRIVSTKHGNETQFGFIEWKYQYDYGTGNAFRSTTALTPNYNAAVVDGHEGFKNVSTSWDTRGTVLTSQEPDLSGYALVVKDNLGRPRFTRKNVADLSGDISGVSYISYDRAGRISETGVLKDVSKSMDEYRTSADDANFPSADQTCWQKRYLYDTDQQTGNNQQFLRGRLYGLVGNMNLIVDNPTDSCFGGHDKGESYIFYKYDQRGRTIGISEVTDATVHNSAYQYNNLGAKLAVTHASTDRMTDDDRATGFEGLNEDQKRALLFDSSDQTTVYYPLNSLGQLSAICSDADCRDTRYASDYRYDVYGKISSNKLNNEALTQTRIYDFQERLTKLETTDSAGTAFAETLSYDPYQAGNIRQADYTGTAISTEQHRYDYSYDIWGRLTEAERHEGVGFATRSRKYEYSYDHNGNIIAKKILGSGDHEVVEESAYAYQSGKNQLASVVDSVSGRVRNFVHNFHGAITSFGNSEGKTNLYVRDSRNDRVHYVGNAGYAAEYSYDPLNRPIVKQIFLPPGQPTGLTATSGNAQVTLAWDDPSDSSITGYEYLSQSQSRSEAAKLTASDGAADDEFGTSVAVDGDTMVVGADAAEGNSADSGAAYVFTRQSGGWGQVAKLTAHDGATDDRFGSSVAVDGDTVVVGADAAEGNSADSGAAYVFTRQSGGWGQVAKLTVHDGATDDRFGTSVAVDGDTVVVGADAAEGNSAQSGAAYVFKKPDPGWATATETAKLTAHDGAAGDNFGYSVAVDGDTVAMGAYLAHGNSADSGAAYVFKKPDTGWATATETVKLTAHDGAAGDNFGYSVAVDGDTVVVGAYLAHGNSAESGAAYVFKKPDTGWVTATETAKLSASDGAADDEFGHSVAVDGDTVAVGAAWDDDNGADSGAVYVFTKPGTGWTTTNETAKLTASDGAAYDNFGHSVAVDGDTVAVGATYGDGNGADSGAAYVYEVSVWTTIPDSAAGGTNATSATVTGLTNGAEYNFWIRATNVLGAGPPSESATAALTPTGGPPTGLAATPGNAQVTLTWDDQSDNSITGYEYLQAEAAKVISSDGAAYDNFGHSVAVDGDTMVVGAYLADGNSAESGAAYVFTRQSGGWRQVARLTAHDGAADDRFGYSVAVDGDTVAVGAYRADGNSADSGAAYVFTRQSGGWRQVARLTAHDGAAGDNFGYSVALDGDTVAVGAYLARYNSVESGAAYVFTKPDAGWTTARETAKLTAHDGAAGDYFGYSVALDGDTVVVGAFEADGNSAQSGAAYVFTKPDTGWATTTETARLTAHDGAAGDRFGLSVAVDGDTVAVGHPGAIYVFTKPDTGWATATETAKLTSRDGATEDWFGSSVAVDGDTVVVGDYQADGNSTDSGAVYVFTKPDTEWVTATETVKLTAHDGAADDYFGYSVAVDRDTVAVGAYQAHGNSAQSGAAYVYEISAWTAVPDSAAGGTNATSATVTGLTNGAEYSFWIRATNSAGAGPASEAATAALSPKPDQPTGLTTTPGNAQVTLTWDDPSDNSITGYEYLQAEAAKLTASDGAAYDNFGHSVAVDGDTMVVGAYLADGNSADSGAAYVFTRQSGGWRQVATLTVSDRAAVDYFGYSVAVDGDTVAMGAYLAHGNSADSGAAYVFKKPDTGWATATETVKLTAHDGAAGDNFGYSVAVDGDTVVVGAYLAHGNSAESGAAYVFAKPDTGWATATETAKLSAHDGAAVDWFGYSVAVDGDTMVVGAAYGDGNGTDSGAAYVFTTPDTGWATATEAAKLTAHDGATEDWFGHSVAVDGDTMVVGAYLADGNSADSGAIYVFTKPDTGWTTTNETAKLTASDGAADDEFGHSVAVDWDTVAVGAAWDDDNGSAYVFKKPDRGWTTATETAKLSAHDGAVVDQFGSSLAVDGDTVAVGAIYGDGNSVDSGAVYVYEVSAWTAIPDSAAGGTNATSATVTSLTNGAEYSFRIRATNSAGAGPASEAATAVPMPKPDQPTGLTATPGNAQVTLTWDDPSDNSITGYEYLSQAEVAKLTASDGPAYDEFGHSVAVDGDTMVVGAYQAHGNSAESGAAYVFTRQSGGWRQVAKLTVHDGATDDEFGHSVAVDGDTVVVGAYLAHGNSADSGAAYVFAKPDTGWATATETVKLTAHDGSADDRFGSSVAVDGDTVAVSAVRADGNSSESGAAYVFAKPDTGWATATETAKLSAHDGAAGDKFGLSVAMDGDTVVVGAYLADGNSADSGAAYVFAKPDTGWATATETVKLTAHDGAAVDWFGYSVAMDGDTVAVGAVLADGSSADSGAAYVFTKPDTGWATTTETAKLTAHDGAAVDYFGSSVAVDGDTVVVGAYQADDNGSESGAAYVFAKPDTGWATATETVKLTAHDGSADDRFGYSVAVDGDTVAVGAFWADGNSADSGAVYVYEVSAWTAVPDSAAGGSNATSATVTGLINGTEYSFRIRATNATGVGPASEAATAALSHTGGPPDQPTGLTATPGNTQVTLTWDDPSDSSITGYEYLSQAETAKLIAHDGAAYDEFGHSVAVDGDTMVVGAYLAHGNSAESGAAYVFTRQSGGWGQVAKLTVHDGATDDGFGSSVAVDGDTVVVGADAAEGNSADSGAAYVFKKPDTGWATATETAKLTAHDGAAVDWFGSSVAVEGDTVVVGAYRSHGNSADSGAAYVFKKPDPGWATATETAKLSAHDGAAGDHFGYSVALDGDTVAVGATYGDGNSTESGAAYVFTKPDTGWVTATETAKLTAHDGAADDRFGYSVAVDGDTVAVAHPGAAYVFTKPDTGWTTTNETAKLTASDGAADDWFGHSVAVDGDTVAVGAIRDDDNGVDSGAVYVFTKPGTGWTTTNETDKLTAHDGAAVDRFGYSVAVDGDTVAVGALGDDDNGPESGSAYVYVYEVSAWTAVPDSAAGGTNATSATATGLTNGAEYSFWIRATNALGPGPPSEAATAALTPTAGQPTGLTATPGNAQVTLTWDDPSDSSITGYEYLSQAEAAKLIASDGAAYDYFGHSVAVDGDTMVVGAYQAHGNSAESGAAYVFTRQSGQWREVAKLTAHDGAADDEFGYSVAVDGDTVVVGAYLADGNGADSGAAYVFAKPDTGWTTATETAKLTAHDGAAEDNFGYSVAVDGDTVAVGALNDDGNSSESGAAYVFTKPDTGWATATETAKLTAHDGAAYDEFGLSVAVDGDTVVVGATYGDGSSAQSGAVYVFTKQSGGWGQVAKLTASDGAADDNFGYSVAVDGDTVVVGAYQAHGNSADSGAIYMFTKPDTGWTTATETVKLTAHDGVADDQFGLSVAVDGDTVAVGAAWDDDNGSESGSAYVFKKPATGWTTTNETVKLTAPDGAVVDQFGYSVAVDGDTVAVGAIWDDDNGSDSGAAYVYEVSAWTAVPDSAAGGTNATSATVTGLNNGAEYSFRIRATNVLGAGPPSEAATAALTLTESALTLSQHDSDGADGLSISHDDEVSVPRVGVEHGPAYNDQISSLTVADGYTVEVYEHANYEGQQLTFVGPRSVGVDELDPHGMNDAISSYKLYLTPAGLSLGEGSDTGASAADGITNQTAGLAITGCAEADSTVTLYQDGIAIEGTVLADTVAETCTGDTAQFTKEIDLPVDGEYAITFVATSANGIESAPSAPLTITVDTTVNAPAALDLADADDSGASATDNVTNQTDGLTITGCAEAGSVVIIYDNGSVTDAIASATGDGCAGGQTFTVDRSLAEGRHQINAVALDLAGNVSVVSAGISMTVDATGPLAVLGPVSDGQIGIYGSLDTVVLDVAVSDGETTVTKEDLSPAYVATGKTTGEFAGIATPYGGLFGYALDFDGDTVVVGVPDDAAGGVGRGSIYILRELTGDQDYDDPNEIKVVNSHTPGLTLIDNGGFGQGVAIHGDTIVVSAPAGGNSADGGSIYVLTGDYEGADDITRISGITVDPDLGNGANFGSAVDFDGQRILVGAAKATANGQQAGAVYVLESADGNGQFDGEIQSTKISHQTHGFEVQDGSRFGRSVALDGPRIIVGAYLDDTSGTNQGQVYILQDLDVDHDFGDPPDVVRLNGNTAGIELADQDRFGNAVAVYGNRLFVSAVRDGSDEDGVVYVLEQGESGIGEIAKLNKDTTGVDLGSGDLFGRAVAVGQDRILVGAPRDDTGGVDLGAFYTIKLKYVAQLSADEMQAFNEGAITVTISATDRAGNAVVSDGTFVHGVAPDPALAPDEPAGVTATVGDRQVTLSWSDPSDDSITGYEYLLRGEIAKLIASEGADDDEFGYSMAMDGDTLVVGTHGDDDDRGAAYVFARESGEWSQVAKLTASDGAGADHFGLSVAIDGNTVVVGSPWDNTSAGSAYVFVKPGNGWTDANETAKLTALDGAAGDYFGQSVAIDGDTVVVGAYNDDDSGPDSGSAYLFTKPATGWDNATETAKLTASDGAAGDYFGHSVAVSGDTVAVGAYEHDNGKGAVYVFVEPGNGWADATETAKLTASDGFILGYLGHSVAIDGDTVAAGAHTDRGSKGAVYLFVKPSGGWADATETAKLTASDEANYDQLGYSVAMDGDVVVAGAHGDGDDGSAYVFKKSGDDWVDATETAKLAASDGAAGDQFGWSVAVDGDTVVVGARHDDDHGDESGSAHVYAVPDWAVIPDSASGETNDTSYTKTGLVNDAEYTFWIRALNAVGTGPASDAVTAVPTATAVNAPPVAVDDATITPQDTPVDVDVVANDTDPDPEDTLSVTAVTAPSNGAAMITPGSSTTVTYIPDLAFNGADTFDYTVSDGTVTATGTVTVTVTTANEPPDAANDHAATYENTPVDIDVVDNDSDPDGDPLSVVAVTAPSNGTAMITPGSSTTVTYIPDLAFTGVDSFDYTVSDGTVTDTGTVTVNVGPAPPTGLTATPGDGQLTLHWTDPGAPHIIEYQYSTDGGTTFADIPGSSATTTSYTVTGLSTGTEYTIALRAVNAAGSGAAATATATTLSAPPSNLVAAPDSTRIVLQWDTGHSGITHYLISSVATGSGQNPTETVVAAGSGPKTTASVTSLTNSTQYTFTVQAADVSGGEAVVTSVAASVVATPTVAVLAAPTNLTATPGDGQATVTWDNPNNITIRKYQYSTDGGASFNHMNASGRNTTSFIFTGLTNGTEYQLAIRASNLSGESAPAAVTATPSE